MGIIHKFSKVIAEKSDPKLGLLGYVIGRGQIDGVMNLDQNEGLGCVKRIWDVAIFGCHERKQGKKIEEGIQGRSKEFNTIKIYE